jgi:hypothetical protein
VNGCVICACVVCAQALCSLSKSYRDVINGAAPLGPTSHFVRCALNPAPTLSHLNGNPQRLLKQSCGDAIHECRRRAMQDSVRIFPGVAGTLNRTDAGMNCTDLVKHAGRRAEEQHSHWRTPTCDGIGVVQSRSANRTSTRQSAQEEPKNSLGGDGWGGVTAKLFERADLVGVPQRRFGSFNSAGWGCLEDRYTIEDDRGITFARTDHERR